MTDHQENVTERSGESLQNEEGKKPLLIRLSTKIISFWKIDIEENSNMNANQLAGARTDLAMKRTLMAADRTLMAWVRTALSMISFGFTIYKVLESLQKSGQEVAVQTSPENVGLFLIGLGTISMAMGTVEYWQNIKELRKTLYFHIIRPAFVMAIIISVAGVLTFISVIAKIL